MAEHMELLGADYCEHAVFHPGVGVTRYLFSYQVSFPPRFWCYQVSSPTLTALLYVIASLSRVSQWVMFLDQMLSHLRSLRACFITALFCCCPPWYTSYQEFYPNLLFSTLLSTLLKKSTAGIFPCTVCNNSCLRKRLRKKIEKT